MSDELDEILDGLFHVCAWAAYLDEARDRQDWPDPEATRRRAFDYYEQALAEKNRTRTVPEAPTDPVAIAEAVTA